MKNGLAILHYGYRTSVENAELFAKQGFDSVSILVVYGLSLSGRRAKQVISRFCVATSISLKLFKTHNFYAKSRWTNDICFKAIFDMEGITRHLKRPPKTKKSNSYGACS